MSFIKCKIRKEKNCGKKIHCDQPNQTEDAEQSRAEQSRAEHDEFTV
jgi:hypothetical protein